MAPKDDVSRRDFLASAAGGLALTIVPRHVLGGAGHTAPSDKLTLAYIGCGTQGIREMLRLVSVADVQITAVCDPVKDGTNYVDWDKTGIRDSVRELLGAPEWGAGVAGIRAGRDMAKEIIEAYYAKQRAAEKFQSVASYADFRELLDKERDLDSVKVMTPDHLHATIAIAAMKKKKHVAMHKPLSNRVAEVRMVVDTARRTGVQTHLLAWRAPITAVQQMILDGAIGNLKEVHNWTDRPFWPQALALPTERPPVPPNFDWDLWLGPERERPYHPSYTHALFRGWYDFGGGSVADMGNYSLWPIFMALDLPVPYSVEAQSSSSAQVDDQVSTITRNDYAFPYANRLSFKFAAHGRWPALKLYWYDGGMRPFTPDELLEDRQSIPATGTLFVGDRGTILNGELIPAKRMRDYRTAKGLPEPSASETHRGGRGAEPPEWVAAFKGGRATAGSFLNAASCSEAIALAGAAIRHSRTVFNEGHCAPALLWDAKAMEFSNASEANPYLRREYRDGWKLTAAEV
ncbi:MAG TPA: Gfo/Idh/MocA family oxidoreductase [Vicinamibacteria bacterium]|nr:Gfo/Idh/MocA family oxidoreductase [Vicinamibacteria bacterium]